MKPILFNTDMVRALLDGQKKVTRRIIKPQPFTECDYGGVHEFVTDDFGLKFKCSGFACRKCGYGVSPPHSKYPCGTSFIRPKYKPGDILYVRETWTVEDKRYYYRADFDSDFLNPCETLSGGYPAECASHPGCEDCCRTPTRIRWHPSIHMPKEASRLFLRVTNVRVERLQDMTEDDALREGVYFHPEMRTLKYSCDKYDGPTAAFWNTALEVFRYNIWDDTIQEKDKQLFGWDANPWVWVYEFEKYKKSEEIEQE